MLKWKSIFSEFYFFLKIKKMFYKTYLKKLNITTYLIIKNYKKQIIIKKFIENTFPFQHS
jgi:hypothetical protein